MTAGRPHGAGGQKAALDDVDADVVLDAARRLVALLSDGQVRRLRQPQHVMSAPVQVDARTVADMLAVIEPTGEADQ